MVAALVVALGDNNANARARTAGSLGQLGQTSPEVVEILIELLRKADSWIIRRNSAELLGRIGISDDTVIQALWRGLLDSDNDVRTACAQAVAFIGQRFPEATQTIGEQLVLALQDPEFSQQAGYTQRTGHDYAFDALWLLIAGGRS